MSTAHFVTVAVVLGLRSAAPAARVRRRKRSRPPKARPRPRSARPVRSTSSARRAGRRRLRQAQRRRASWWMRAGRSRSRTIGASARSAESPWTRTTTSGSITGRGRWTRARPARCRERRRTTEVCRSARSAIQGPTPNAARAAVSRRRPCSSSTAKGTCSRHGADLPIRASSTRTAARRTAVSGRRASTASSWTTTTSCTCPATARTAGPVSSRGWRPIRGRRRSATTRTY